MVILFKVELGEESPLPPGAYLYAHSQALSAFSAIFAKRVAAITHIPSGTCVMARVASARAEELIDEANSGATVLRLGPVAISHSSDEGSLLVHLNQ